MSIATTDILVPIEGTLRPNTTIRKAPWSIRALRIYFDTIGRVLPRLAAKQALQIFFRPRSRYRTSAFGQLVSQSEAFSVFSNGNKIKGRIWENRGPTVLLVHGWETSGLHLGSFIEPLLKLGYKVVIFDGPAHGESTGSHTDLQDFALAMRQIIYKVGPVDHIIAHSFGGVASVYLASRFSSEITLKKMVLISVPNKLTSVISEFARVLKIPKKVKLQMYQLIVGQFDQHPRDIETAVMGQRMFLDEILIVHDRHDSILPFHHSLEITHDLDRAVLLETKYLGHNRLLKNSQVIERVTQFLSD